MTVQERLFPIDNTEIAVLCEDLKQELDKTRRALFHRISDLQKENEWLETQLEVLIGCFNEARNRKDE